MVELEQNTTPQTTIIEDQSNLNLSHEKEAVSKETTSGKITVKKIFKILFRWSTLELMLSHHPNCEVYDSHVFKIGKLRLCRGCFLSYPPVYALLIIFMAWPAARDFFVTQGLWIQNLWWFVISFGFVTIFGYFIGNFSLFVKDISKFARGAWAGFLLIVMVTQHWGFKIGAAVILIAGMAYLSLHRGKDMEKTCDECEWGANFNLCPGWQKYNFELNEVDTPQKEEY